MTTSKFEPEADKPYGTCATCGIEIATKALSREHMDATAAEAEADVTFKESRTTFVRHSHSIRVANPSRDRRIANAVSSIVDDAMSEALDKVEELIDAEHVTRDEATTALAEWATFADSWRENGFDSSIDEGHDETAQLA